MRRPCSRPGRSRAGEAALAIGAATVLVAAAAAPAGAVPPPDSQSCHLSFVDGSTYSVSGLGLDIGGDLNMPEPYSAPTTEECTSGSAALQQLVAAALPSGTSKKVGAWSCVADVTGGACNRDSPTRLVRVDAVCETADGGGGDDEGGGSSSTDCLLALPGTGGGGSGSGSGSGSGAGGAATKTFVIDRSGKRRNVPTTLDLPQAVRGTRLTWSGWGRTITIGRGRVRTSGHAAQKGRITLSMRKTCADGRRVYTRATARVGRRTVRLTRPGCSALGI